jgi:hypothetical protein
LLFIIFSYDENSQKPSPGLRKSTLKTIAKTFCCNH